MLIPKVTVQGLIDDIAARFPHPFTDTQVVKWCNDAMHKVMKEIPLTVFDNVATAQSGVSTYVLPDNCLIQNILSLFINGQEYTPIPYTATKVGYCYCPKYPDNANIIPSFDHPAYGGIELYPTPDDSLDGKGIELTFNSMPPDLTTTLMSEQYIWLDNQYIELITYYVISTIALAGNNPDEVIANNYVARYNALFEEMNLQKLRSEIRNPIKSMSNRWW